jgi:Major Facilitator Superfamily
VTALVILLIGQAMASMDEEILVVASPNLRRDLHASAAELQLVLAMYTITFAALVVTGARLGDVMGQRRAFLLGLGGFTLSSFVGGLAPTPTALIVARAVQGASAAIMTPQVLSIIQLQFRGETRARALGAYSMVLAAGVAVGQILGGFLVSLHLLSAAWRPALLLNAPIGASLLLVARRGLPAVRHGVRRPLDAAGATLLTVALLALVVPLTLGRDTGWPAWIWPCLFGCAVALGAFLGVERHRTEKSRDPLFDLGVMRQPGVAAGVVAVTLTMACYAGFLVTLTLHLQNSLRFSPLDAGLIFTAYATGFAATSVAWTHARPTVRDRLPVLGPLIMGAGLAAIGMVAVGGGWPVAPATGLLFCAGAGHGCSFSPLASRLTNLVRPAQAADLSGLIITASLVGQVVGVAVFVDVYFSALPHGSAHALALTSCVMAAVLLPAAACARYALRRGTTSTRSRTRRRRYRAPRQPRTAIDSRNRCSGCGGD